MSGCSIDNCLSSSGPSLSRRRTRWWWPVWGAFTRSGRRVTSTLSLGRVSRWVSLYGAHAEPADLGLSHVIWKILAGLQRLYKVLVLALPNKVQYAITEMMSSCTTSRLFSLFHSLWLANCHSHCLPFLLYYIIWPPLIYQLSFFSAPSDCRLVVVGLSLCCDTVYNNALEWEITFCQMIALGREI